MRTTREVRQALSEVQDQDRPVDLEWLTGVAEGDLESLTQVRDRLLEWVGRSKFLRLKEVVIQRKHPQVVVVRLMSETRRYDISADADRLMAFVDEPATGKGNDLCSGRFGLLTWCDILSDIVGLETKPVRWEND